jgi:hypothetical protein
VTDHHLAPFTARQKVNGWLLERAGPALMADTRLGPEMAASSGASRWSGDRAVCDLS